MIYLQLNSIKFDDVNNVFEAIELIVDGNTGIFRVDNGTQTYDDLWNWMLQVAADFKASGYDITQSAYAYLGTY